MPLYRRAFILIALSCVPLAPALALAQSNLSRASQSLSEASMALPAGSVELLQAGGTFSVVALRPVAAGIEVVLEASAAGGRVSLVVARELAEAASLVVGASVMAVAVSGGFVLWAGSEAVAFIADASLAPHVHRRELKRDELVRREAR